MFISSREKISNLITTASRIAHLSKYSKFFDKVKIKLPGIAQTRWHSTITLLEKVKEHYSEINQYLVETNEYRILRNFDLNLL
eukprot:GAHX01007526.1.p1 GENE.GAHX01007526.1~~GAHX01007526.1.p1  ORF type:complete len:83 (+),score=4.49 GAHX01007526.1:267-515(+)